MCLLDYRVVSSASASHQSHSSGGGWCSDFVVVVVVVDVVAPVVMSWKPRPASESVRCSSS